MPSSLRTLPHPAGPMTSWANFMAVALGGDWPEGETATLSSLLDDFSAQ